MPAACSADFKVANDRSCLAVKVELDISAALGRSCTGCEFIGTVAEVNACDLDIASLFDASYAYRIFFVLFGLDALAPTDSFRLDALKRVERLYLFGTVFS